MCTMYLLEDSNGHGYITYCQNFIIGMLMEWSLNGEPPREVSAFKDTESLTLFELTNVSPKFCPDEAEFTIIRDENGNYKSFVYRDGHKVRVYKKSFSCRMLDEYCL